ncbi:hypothetical protein ACDI16_02620 [Oceanobacillus caeni]|uniref:hypothetical protein n=1 Tax=Virgibacillus sp. SK37 TaxID=403957 RepID=UPI0014445769|nr:hypothetical protein [Virgibacillus sp. SK37]
MKNKKEDIEILKTIKRDNYVIQIPKQENLEKNKKPLYDTIAKVLYEQYIEEQKKNK